MRSRHLLRIIGSAEYLPTTGVAFTSKMSKSASPKPYGSWTFHKVFGDEDFIASGYCFIHAGAEKSLKNVRDNTYVSTPPGLQWPRYSSKVFWKGLLCR